MLSAGLVLVPAAAAVVDDDIGDLSLTRGEEELAWWWKIWRGAPAPLTGWFCFCKKEACFWEERN
jgi:hypothetical protein